MCQKKIFLIILIMILFSGLANAGRGFFMFTGAGIDFKF